jgi:hypothetical protein
MKLGFLRGLVLACLAALVAACAAVTAPAPTTTADAGRMMDVPRDRIYELRIYQANPGRLADLSARFRDHTTAMFEKHGMTNVGYWTPIDPADERIIYILSYPSMEAREASWAAFGADEEWRAARTASEANGPLVASVSSTFMQLADYSANLDLEPPPEPRIFELRVYTTPPGRLEALHARFRDHTLDLFSKHHIGNLLYFRLTPGQEHSDDQLVYIVTHPSMEARQANFLQSFLQDPEWQAVVAETEADGPLAIPGGIAGVPMQATDYSPLR